MVLWVLVIESITVAVIYGKEKLWLVYLADQKRWVAFDGPDTVDDTVPDVGNWIFSSVEDVREPGDHVWVIMSGQCIALKTVSRHSLQAYHRRDHS